MEIKNYTKETFTVIGKEGSSEQGSGFMQRLWADATIHLNEVVRFAKKDETGTLVGIWGLMNDFSRSFLPWEDGSKKGLYLVGVEADTETQAPTGWVKWTVPSFEYIYAIVEDDYQKTLSAILKHIEDNGQALAGAIFDYTSLEEDGQQYIMAPIRRI